MASQTIASLNYKLFLDTQGLAQGTKETQKEFRQLRKSFRTAETAAEKWANELEILEKAVRNEVPGALEVLNRRMEQHQARIVHVEKAWHKMGKSWGIATKTIKGLIFNFKTLGAAIATGVIARSITQQTKALDELGKVADKTGASVEFLSGLQHAAALEIGLSAEETTKAITKMQNRIGQALQGSGELKAFFDRMDIDLQQFRNTRPEETFRLLTKELKNMTSAQERLAAGTRLFDDELADLVQVMLKVDEIDFEDNVFTQDQVNNAMLLTDEMTKFGRQWEIFTKRATSSMALGLQPIFKEMNKLFDRLNQFEQSAIGKFLIGAGGVIASGVRTFGQNVEIVASGDPRRVVELVEAPARFLEASQDIGQGIARDRAILMIQQNNERQAAKREENDRRRDELLAKIHEVNMKIQEENFWANDRLMNSAWYK